MSESGLVSISAQSKHRLRKHARGDPGGGRMFPFGLQKRLLCGVIQLNGRQTLIRHFVYCTTVLVITTSETRTFHNLVLMQQTLSEHGYLTNTEYCCKNLLL